MLRLCYKKFAKNVERLVLPEEPNGEPKISRSIRRKEDHVENTIFKPTCIFCNKKSKIKVKKNNSWTSENMIIFESYNWKSVVDQAERKEDEDILIGIRKYDLSVCGAKYHPT